MHVYVSVCVRIFITPFCVTRIFYYKEMGNLCNEKIRYANMKEHILGVTQSEQSSYYYNNNNKNW